MENIIVTINGKEISASPDKTILQVVHVNKLVPSCATKISNGMKIQTRNQKVVDTRKTALELIMSNHYADCIGPCKNNCPAGVDAQSYIALISMGQYEEALKLIKESNPLPLRSEEHT